MFEIRLRRSPSTTTLTRAVRTASIATALVLVMGIWSRPALAQCGADPGNDTRGDATDLNGACGTTAAAINCLGDLDFYRFTAPSDGLYTLETTGSTDTFMELQDDEGHVIESDDDDGDGYNALISRNLGMGATYFIKVNEYGDNATGDYNLVVSGCAPAGCGSDPGNDTRGDATDLHGACDATQAAIDCVGDVDFYRFTAPSDGLYTLETAGSTDTFMELQDDEGHVIESDDDDGADRNAMIHRSLGMGTTYFIKVNEYGDDATGDYYLVISGCAPAGCGSDPGNDTRGDATDLNGACGTTSAAFDCVGDVDFYRFTAPSDGLYTLETTGSTDTFMELQDDEGRVIESDDDDGADRNALISRNLGMGTTYFIRVNEYGDDGTGDYALVVSGCSPSGCGSDPGNDTRGDATGLSGCGTTSAAVDCSGDIDFYWFQAPSSGSYDFSVSATNSFYIALYDTNGNLLEQSTTSVTRSLTANELVYARVLAGVPGETFTYDLTVSGCSPAGCGSDPGNDTRGDATDLNGACGTTPAAIDCLGDMDFYRFTAPSDGTYTLETTGNTDTYMQLQDDEGREIESNDDGGTDRNARISRTLGMGRTYFIRIHEYGDDATGDYNLVISGCSPAGCGSDPGNDTRGDATDLGGQCGNTPAAFDCAGDIDYYRFTPQADGTYTLETTGTTDTELRLLNEGGGELAYNDDGGTDRNSRIVFNMARGVTYFVKLNEYGNDGTGDYVLQVSGCSAGGCGNDPGNDSISTATDLSGACGTTHAAIDCLGDTDFYRFTAPSDGTYVLETTGSTNTYLLLLDDAGREIVGNDDGGTGTNARISRDLVAGTTYFIRVHEANEDHTGDYSLVISGCATTGCGSDPGNDTRGNATDLSGACGTTPAAIDCLGDKDFYRFTAPSDGTYTLETTGSTDTFMQLQDDEGRVIESDDDDGDGYNASISRDLGMGRTYFIRVNEWGDDYAGPYSLVISGCATAGCGSDPGNDSMSSATALAGCGRTSASVDCAGDVDFYRFTTPGGGRYTFGTSGGGTTYVRILDSAGATLAGGVDGTPVDLSGLQTVYVRVQANDGTSIFAYDLEVSGCSGGVCGADPGDDTIQTASTLVGCTTASAAVDCAADVDVYSFTAANTGQYTFTTTPNGIIYMTAMDGAGNVINGAVSGMTLTLAAGQTVYIQVAAFTAGDTPAYELAVTGCTQPDGCGNDPGDDTMATATPLSGCGASPAQVDCAGDHDVYVMTAPVSGAYVFETQGALDTELVLLDSVGTLIAADDDSGADRNARVRADLVNGSTYFVAVNEYGDDGTGAYSLVVDGCSGSVCTGDPGNNDRSGATPLSVPGSTSAAFDCPGDVDFYTLTPATSATFAFETSGSTDARLWLLDDAGATLGFDDSSGSGANARLEHALVAATKYYLKLEEASGATGAYGLDIDQVAQATTYRYVVAASAKVGGVGGTNWVSDLVIYNPGQSSASITVEAWIRDRDNSTPQTASLSLGPGQLRREQDVLHALFGIDSGAAALHVISDAPLVVASRTFNSTAGGTYGQFIAGVPPSLAVAPGDKGYLQGFVENADYRSNLGLVNLEDHSIAVKVSFRWPDGKALGATETLTLPPYGYTQATQVLAGLVSGDVSLAWAELSSTDGRFLAYASVVDQRTGDPVYRPVQLAAAGRTEVALPGLAKVAGAAGTNWVSDLGFLNPGADQVTLSLELWRRDAPNSSPDLRQMVLAPKACTRSADVLDALFGESSGAASVRLSADARVLADGRTFNQVASGTYGQYIAGMQVGNAITAALPAYLVMTEEDGSFRTNLGLMNLSPSASAQVQLRAFDATGRSIGALETITLGARAVTQLNRVLERFTSASVPLAVLRIEVATSGGQVLAYGSVVDEATGDPVFEVPAMPAP